MALLTRKPNYLRRRYHTFSDVVSLCMPISCSNCGASGQHPDSTCSTCGLPATPAGDVRGGRGFALSSLVLVVNLCGVLLWIILESPRVGLTTAFVSLVALDMTWKRSAARRGAGRPLRMSAKVGFFLSYAISVVEILLRVAASIVIAAAVLLMLVEAVRAVLSWV